MVDRVADEFKTLRDGIADLDRRLAVIASRAGGAGAVDVAALAAVFADSTTIDFVVSAGTGTISAEVQRGSISTPYLSQPYSTPAALEDVETAVDADLTALTATLARARANSGFQGQQAQFHFLDGTGTKVILVDDSAEDELEVTVRTGAVASIPFHIGTPLVLTDQVSAQAAFGGALERVSVLDLANITQVRFTALVTALSGSANTPLIRLRYRASGYSATIGNYSTIGTSSVELSLASTGFKDSGWMTLVNGAKTTTTAVTVDQIGGDGAADPAVTSVIAYFR